MQKNLTVLLVFMGITTALHKNAVASAGNTTLSISMETMGVFIPADPETPAVVGEVDESTPKRSLCLFWGLIGNCGFQAEASFEADLGKVSDLGAEQSETELADSKNYRSILWGAVQWSKRTSDKTHDEAADASQVQSNL